MLRTILAVSLVLSPFAFAQHQHHSAPDVPVEMFTGIGGTHHPISTKSPEAQKYFDQGLALLYGFNHEEAAKSFAYAASLDPNLAIAHWGIAIVNGANYNAPEFPELLKNAREEIKIARSLISSASPSEKALIMALEKRYSDSVPDAAQRAQSYADAMAAVHEQFPDDLDIATLYAESLMNLTPWRLWTKDGKPGPYTEQVIAILENVLRRNPKHIGANHYYIHAVEPSDKPELGLAAADRLRALKLSAGHLVHMPGHIYFRTGDYASAADVNVLAAEADLTYLNQSGTKQGLYAGLYYSHNLHFLALADMMAGRFERAYRAANSLYSNAEKYDKSMPMIEGFLPVKTYVLVRFEKWDEVLAQPEPEKSLHLYHGVWQWSRGMAFAANHDLNSAEREQKALQAALASVPTDLMVDQNPVAAVLGIANNMLLAQIAEIKKDYAAADQHYRQAAQAHDDFNYIEPPEWPFPVREYQGRMLLRAGRAKDAEAIFRADLQKHPRNGRTLFGLAASLRAQGKNEAARLIELEFKQAWQHADIQLAEASPGSISANAE